MEEEEIVWEIGEIIAPRGGGESPPLSDEHTPPPPPPPTPVYLPALVFSYAWPSLFDEPTPPLFDKPTTLPPVYLPASVSSLTRGDAAAAAASISNKRGRVAASSKAIQGLREVTAPPTDGSADCCAICLQDLVFRSDPSETPGLRLRAMPCSHTFHEHCIFEWLPRNAVCPLCRHQLPTEDAHEQEREQGRRIRSRFVYDEGVGRRIRSQFVYDENGQFLYGSWHYSSHPFPDDEEDGEEEEEVDPEQQRRTASLELHARWLSDRRSAAAPAEDQSIRSQS